MKLISLLVLMTASATVFAQTPLDGQIELVRQAAQTDRQVIIMGNVHFTAAESEQFWPAWREYRAAKSANGDRLIAVIKDFAANYGNMTDQKASELMTDSFSIRMQDLVIQQNFAKEMKTFMPAVKVMRVMQIESKLDTAIEMNLAAEIPLAR